MSVAVPTTLNPWFVVTRWQERVGEGWKLLEYHAIPDDHSTRKEKEWTSSPGDALLFTNLTSAARIADAVDGEIVLLWKKEQLAFYGRKVE